MRRACVHAQDWWFAWVGGIGVAVLLGAVGLVISSTTAGSVEAADRLNSECWRNSAGWGGGWSDGAAMARLGALPVGEYRRWDGVVDGSGVAEGDRVFETRGELLAATYHDVGSELLSVYENDRTHADRDNRFSVEVKTEWVTGYDGAGGAPVDQSKLIEQQVAAQQYAITSIEVSPNAGTDYNQEGDKVDGPIDIPPTGPEKSNPGTCVPPSSNDVGTCPGEIISGEQVRDLVVTDVMGTWQCGGGTICHGTTDVDQNVVAGAEEFHLRQVPDPERRTHEEANVIPLYLTEVEARYQKVSDAQDTSEAYGLSSYERALAPDLNDGNQDELLVTFVLDGQHRADSFIWGDGVSPGVRSGAREKVNVPLFGGEWLELYTDPDGNIDGYRQSYLWGNDDLVPGDIQNATQPWLVGRDALANGSIRWPVGLSDVAWYLYVVPEFPEVLYDEKEHVNGLVGDAQNAGVFEEGVRPVLDEDGKAEGRSPSSVYYSFAGDTKDGRDLGNIFDVSPSQDGGDDGEWRWGKTAETTGGLVKAGAVAPLDLISTGDVTSENRYFEFRILENARFNDLPDGGPGSETHRRLGITDSRDAGKRWTAESWPNGAVDPTDTHLLILTFYEAKVPDRNQPTLQFRRIMCRVVVPPFGVEPAVSGWQKLKLAFKEGIGKLVELVKYLPERLSSLAANALIGLTRTGRDMVQSGGCIGVDVVASAGGEESVYDDVVGGEGAAARALTSMENEELEAQQDCAKETTDSIQACDNLEQSLNPDACPELYRPKVTVQLLNWYDKEDYGGIGGDGPVLDVSARVVEGDPAVGDAAAAGGLWLLSVAAAGLDVPGAFGNEPARPGAQDAAGETETEKLPVGCFRGSCTSVTVSENFLGIGEVELGLEFPEGTATRLDGTVMLLRPDPKLGIDGVLEFVYPKPSANAHVEETTLRFGSLEKLNDPIHGEMDVLSPMEFSSSLFGRSDLSGSLELRSGDAAFEKWMLERLAFGDGYAYEASGYGYTGVWGSAEGVKYTPQAEWVEVDLEEAVCGTPANTRPEFLADYVGCSVPALPFDDVVGALDPRSWSALWAVVGTEICGDVLTATPPGLTYQVAPVQIGWRISWVVAAFGFLLLLVWELLKHSYVVWGENRRQSNVAAIVPRAVLALVMAASSMLILQFILGMASNVTCYVAQAMEVSLWGTVNAGFGAVFNSFTVLGIGGAGVGASALGSAAGATGAAGLVATTLGWGAVAISIVVLIIILVLLWFALKVFFSLLMRVLMLCVLIAIAPIALILYTSEDTAQWTRKWFSMFMSTTLYQVLTVVVLFVGVGLMEGGLVGYESTVAGNRGLSDLIVSFLIGLMSFYLAGRVPGLLNSDVGSVVQGFSQEIVRTAQQAAIIGTTVASMGMTAVGKGLTSMGGGIGGLGHAGTGGALGSIGQSFGRGGKMLRGARSFMNNPTQGMAPDDKK